MSPGLRKFALIAHVVASVGWLGAVAAFLALAIVGVTSDDAKVVRGVYLVMEPTAGYILLPLAIASLVTGAAMSVGTEWGLVRHYWVIFKLLINLVATIILLVYMQTFELMAQAAADPRVRLDAVRNPSPILHATLALVGLVLATVLAIYKPQGATRYARRQARNS